MSGAFVMVDNDGACVTATDKLTVNDGHQTKKHCMTAVSGGTCVAATDNDGRQTRLFLVESDHGLLIYFFL